MLSYLFDLRSCPDRGIDNLAIDTNGVLWAAGKSCCRNSVPELINFYEGLSDALGMVRRQMNDPSALVASSALRIAINRGVGSFYGEKYLVEKVYHHNGKAPDSDSF